MTAKHFEFIVEEPSMEAALCLILPKILGDCSFRIYPHQCKEELLASLPGRLLGYSKWLPGTWRIVVIVDRDDDDCRKLKADLETMGANAGLLTRTTALNQPYVLVNRIVIEELEAWYFGDWAAVQAAYPRAPKGIPVQSKYRDPDRIGGGTWEAFERVLQRGGYFKGGLRKIEAARSIATHMVPADNKSRSFQVLREALVEMIRM
jgi:hypothetical protein